MSPYALWRGSVINVRWNIGCVDKYPALATRHVRPRLDVRGHGRLWNGAHVCTGPQRRDCNQRLPELLTDGEKFRQRRLWNGTHMCTGRHRYGCHEVVCSSNPGPADMSLAVFTP
jgi:hypothetical protein